MTEYRHTTVEQYKAIDEITRTIEFKYSNTQYQKITGDVGLDNVPVRLYQLWYGKDYEKHLSVLNHNRKSHYIWKYEEMNNFIEELKDLEESLEIEFNKLKK